MYVAATDLCAGSCRYPCGAVEADVAIFNHPSDAVFSLYRSFLGDTGIFFDRQIFDGHVPGAALERENRSGRFDVLARGIIHDINAGSRPIEKEVTRFDLLPCWRRSERTLVKE
jgi:hypothetical protein